MNVVSKNKYMNPKVLKAELRRYLNFVVISVAAALRTVETIVPCL